MIYVEIARVCFVRKFYLIQTKFDGFLEIFFIGFVLIIIFNLTFPRLILKGIETYKNNRENLLYLYGYLNQKMKEKKIKKENLNLDCL